MVFLPIRFSCRPPGFEYRMSDSSAQCVCRPPRRAHSHALAVFMLPAQLQCTRDRTPHVADGEIIKVPLAGQHLPRVSPVADLFECFLFAATEGSCLTPFRRGSLKSLGDGGDLHSL